MADMYRHDSKPEGIVLPLLFSPGNPTIPGGAKYIAYYGVRIVKPCKDPFCSCGGLEDKISPDNLCHEVVLKGPFPSRGGECFIAHCYVPPPDRLRFKDHFFHPNTPLSLSPFSETQLIFLGGIGQAGSQVCCLLVRGKQAIMIECGINVGGLESEEAVELYSDFDLLFEILGRGIKLIAILVTHGHFDHFGGIPELLRRMREKGYELPQILGSPFTCTMIHNRVLKNNEDEEDETAPIVLHDLKAGSILEIGPFRVEPFEVFHSVPGSLGFAVRTEGQAEDDGSIIFTGDFKTRWDRHYDIYTILKTLEKLRPVKLLIIDGTNACVPDWAGLERDVERGLSDAYRSAAGTVIYSCFSSHLARISEIVRLASNAGITPAIYGTSFNIPLDAYSRMGTTFSFVRDMRRSRIVIVTGCQANATSVAWRLSQGERVGGFTVNEHHTFVLSAVPIPGRELAVERMLQGFRQQGVRIVVDGAYPDKDHIFGAQVLPVHVSGHGFGNDIRLMIEGLEPEYVLPFHCSQEAMMEVANIATTATSIPESNVLLPDSSGLSIKL